MFTLANIIFLVLSIVTIVVVAFVSIPTVMDDEELDK